MISLLDGVIDQESIKIALWKTSERNTLATKVQHFKEQLNYQTCAQANLLLTTFIEHLNKKGQTYECIESYLKSTMVEHFGKQIAIRLFSSMAKAKKIDLFSYVYGNFTYWTNVFAKGGKINLTLEGIALNKLRMIQVMVTLQEFHTHITTHAFYNNKCPLKSKAKKLSVKVNNCISEVLYILLDCEIEQTKYGNYKYCLYKVNNNFPISVQQEPQTLVLQPDFRLDNPQEMRNLIEGTDEAHRVELVAKVHDKMMMEKDGWYYLQTTCPLCGVGFQATTVARIRQRIKRHLVDVVSCPKLKTKKKARKQRTISKESKASDSSKEQAAPPPRVETTQDQVLESNDEPSSHAILEEVVAEKEDDADQPPRGFPEERVVEKEDDAEDPPQDFLEDLDDTVWSTIEEPPQQVDDEIQDETAGDDDENELIQTDYFVSSQTLHSIITCQIDPVELKDLISNTLSYVHDNPLALELKEKLDKKVEQFIQDVENYESANFNNKENLEIWSEFKSYILNSAKGSLRDTSLNTYLRSLVHKKDGYLKYLENRGIQFRDFFPREGQVPKKLFVVPKEIFDNDHLPLYLRGNLSFLLQKMAMFTFHQVNSFDYSDEVDQYKKNLNHMRDGLQECVEILNKKLKEERAKKATIKARLEMVEMEEIRDKLETFNRKYVKKLYGKLVKRNKEQNTQTAEFNKFTHLLALSITVHNGVRPQVVKVMTLADLYGVEKAEDGKFYRVKIGILKPPPLKTKHKGVFVLLSANHNVLIDHYMQFRSRMVEKYQLQAKMPDGEIIPASDPQAPVFLNLSKLKGEPTITAKNWDSKNVYNNIGVRKVYPGMNSTVFRKYWSTLGDEEGADPDLLQQHSKESVDRYYLLRQGKRYETQQRKLYDKSAISFEAVNLKQVDSSASCKIKFEEILLEELANMTTMKAVLRNQLIIKAFRAHVPVFSDLFLRFQTWSRRDAQEILYAVVSDETTYDLGLEKFGGETKDSIRARVVNWMNHSMKSWNLVEIVSSNKTADDSTTTTSSAIFSVSDNTSSNLSSPANPTSTPVSPRQVLARAAAKRKYTPESSDSSVGESWQKKPKQISETSRDELKEESSKQDSTEKEKSSSQESSSSSEESSSSSSSSEEPSASKN